MSGFMGGLVLGALAGAAVGAWYRTKASKETWEEFLAALPPEWRAVLERTGEDLTARLEKASQVFRQARSETRQRMESDLEAARSSPGSV